VKKFRYLSSLITEDNRCHAEIMVKNSNGENAFSKKRELLKNSLNRNLKKHDG